jgi:hypothetical protein
LAGRTAGLDQSGKLCVQVCQGPLQNFAVAGILGSVKLLEHMLAGQHQSLGLALAGNLTRSQWWFRWTPSRRCLSLLLLDRLTLPSSRHAEIIPAAVMTDVLLLGKCIGKSLMSLMGLSWSHKAGQSALWCWHDKCQVGTKRVTPENKVVAGVEIGFMIRDKLFLSGRFARGGLP